MALSDRRGAFSGVGDRAFKIGAEEDSEDDVDDKDGGVEVTLSLFSIELGDCDW